MIFPDWGTAPAVQEAPLPLFREWAVDWEKGALALRDGEPYTVTGDEALRIWVRLALAPEARRFAFTAHSHDYGNELAALLGTCGDAGIRDSQLRRAITEALTVSPYIRSVTVDAITAAGSRVTAELTVRTVYDTFSTEVEL